MPLVQLKDLSANIKSWTKQTTPWRWWAHSCMMCLLYDFLNSLSSELKLCACLFSGTFFLTALFRHNSHIIQLIRVVCTSTFFRMFTGLCNHIFCGFFHHKWQQAVRSPTLFLLNGLVTTSKNQSHARGGPFTTTENTQRIHTRYAGGVRFPRIF